MDRSTMQHNITTQGIKKANESEKITESVLSDEIHDNLRALSLIQPFSDELREVFEKGMFIKPNTKAFPHIMKYLLTICDATEFKKRFCWPIYNKAAEATFRNSTLELVNKLNVRYNLGFGEVRNKILIFPGGLEFMRVIFELSRLSMQLILKRNGVTDPDNQPSMSLSGAKKHLENLEDVCSFVMDFKKKIENHSIQMKAKTEMMNKLLRKIISNTHITPENILHDRFAESWSDVHEDIIQRGIEPNINYLMQFQDNCQKLEEKITAMFKQQTLTFDVNALSSFSTEMQKLHPHNYQQLIVVNENGHVNLENMLRAFRLSIPQMLESIECYKPRNVKAMAYESNQLDKLSYKTNELLGKIIQLSEEADTKKPKVVPQSNVGPNFEHIESMILSTPTISQETIRRAEISALQSKRLSLLEDMYQLRSNTSKIATKSVTSILHNSQSKRSAQKVFLSPACLFSKEPKNKLDPMAMLSTITKKTKLDRHTSGGRFKPRGMNFGQRFGISNSMLESTRTNDTTLSIPDFSSTLLNQSNELKDTLCNVDEQINTSLTKSIGKTDQKMRSLLAVDFDCSDRDLNSSPSGRLESLVKQDVNVSGVKPIQMNEIDSDKLESPCVTPIQEKPSNAGIFGKSLCRDSSNIENNQNAPNSGAFNLNKMIDENDESLLNMSDQILNDLNDLDFS